jgi:hypothetical protein
MNDLFGQQEDRYCKKYSPGTIIVESLKFFRDNAIQNKSSMLKVTSNQCVVFDEFNGIEKSNTPS